ncbi:MAG: RHS repeat-associated core domain-containing protein, partial [Thermoanaerobaculales bacterium]|nr:RHS repeat-associated core domain-containing protein [Thermoanaerobaculales bacterium]
QMVKWTPDPAAWLVLGEYEVTSTQLVDLAGQAVDSTPLPVSLTHLASDAESVLVVYEAAGDSEPRAESAYGVTSLFQGRGWHEDLGLYYYRARWYAPGVGAFLERDPFEYLDEANSYSFVGSNTTNAIDPLGLMNFGHPYNFLTGIQAHLVFSSWITKSPWAEGQRGMGRKIYPNQSLGTAVRNHGNLAPSKEWKWHWLPDMNEKWVHTAIKSIFRPDALSVGKGGQGGELLELKPVTYLRNPRALTWTLIKIQAEVGYLAAHGVHVQLGNLAKSMPETIAGVGIPGKAVMDIDMSLYTVRILSPEGGFHPGMVFYELLGGASEDLRETIRPWVKVYAPKLRELELASAGAANPGFATDGLRQAFELALASGLGYRMLQGMAAAMAESLAAGAAGSVPVPIFAIIPPEFLPPGATLPPGLAGGA